MIGLYRISCDPAVMLGEPVVKGTRATAELLARKVSEGATAAELIEAYPHLSREEITAAILRPKESPIS
jgi:uncharacterized protein (DUF433 family)